MIRRLVVAGVLAIAIGAPMVEAFDHWDQTLRDGNDTEANAVIAALCVGVAFVTGIGAGLSRLRLLARTFRSESVAFESAQLTRRLAAPPVPTASPPAPLRI